MVVAGMLVVAGMPATLRADLTINSDTTTISSSTCVGPNLSVARTGTATLDVTGGTLTGTHSYLGRGLGSLGITTVAGGTWAVSTSLDVGPHSSITMQGGLASAAGSLLLTSSTMSASTTTVSTGTLTVGSRGMLTLTGSLSVGSSGAGTLALAGNNTYTGVTTVSSGTLAVGIGGTSGSITGDVANSAAVEFNRSNAVAAAVEWELITNSTSDAGTNYDQVAMPTGDLPFSGSTTLDLSFDGIGSTVEWCAPSGTRTEPGRSSTSAPAPRRASRTSCSATRRSTRSATHRSRPAARSVRARRDGTWS